MDEKLEKLIRGCREIKLLEIEAQKIYSELLPFITDSKDQVILQGIIADEVRHEQIAQQAIDLLSTP